MHRPPAVSYSGVNCRGVMHEAKVMHSLNGRVCVCWLSSAAFCRRCCVEMSLDGTELGEVIIENPTGGRPRVRNLRLTEDVEVQSCDQMRCRPRDRSEQESRRRSRLTPCCGRRTVPDSFLH